MYRYSDQDFEGIYIPLCAHAAKWRDIGRSLGFSSSELNVIQSNPVLTAPSSYLRQMISQWLQWYPGDSRGSTSYATSGMLSAALSKVNLDSFVSHLPRGLCLHIIYVICPLLNCFILNYAL